MIRNGGFFGWKLLIKTHNFAGWGCGAWFWNHQTA